MSKEQEGITIDIKDLLMDAVKGYSHDDLEREQLWASIKGITEGRRQCEQK